MSTTAENFTVSADARRAKAKNWPRVISVRVADADAEALAMMARKSSVSPGIMARMLLAAALRASAEQSDEANA